MSAPPDSGLPSAALGDLVELRIDALAAGGDGVGRTADGRVVFVPLSAPGDRIRARLVTLRPRFARAELEEVLEPGPSRVAPPCPVFGECGGCAWQHVDYTAQCEAKRRVVEDALQRVGHLASPGELTFHPSPTPYAYRSRARVHVEGGQVGFRRRRSHELCAVAHCPVFTPPLDEALAQLAADPPRGSGEWELLAGADRVAVHALNNPRAGKAIEWRQGEDRLRISPGVFLQGHAGLHGELLAAVASAVGSGGFALELFAGAGFFTLPLARAFTRVVAVESVAAAVSDLQHNLARAAASHVKVKHARVEVALESEALRSARPDAVLLDPPRTGIDKAVVERLCAMAPRRIAYLSCDPATLARDLALLCAGGYALASVEAFDLFPQTPHVEVLASLRAETVPTPEAAGYTEDDPRP